MKTAWVVTLLLTLLTTCSRAPVEIPSGAFSMGDNFAEGDSDEVPVHLVSVSGFYISKYEVTCEEMRKVLQWAYDSALVTATVATVWNTQGDSQELLDVDDTGCLIRFAEGVFTVREGMDKFPCNEVTWYGAQAYCNYKSDRAGLERCIDFSDWSCDFSKNGYRLPTESEWEKAARGGLTGNHYPWPSAGGVFSDHIDGGDANYVSSGDPFEGPSPVGYYDGNQTPAGPDRANGYGLYDMAGNVWEWCWDWYQADWYSQAGATNNNTAGPAGPLTFRVLRGGSFNEATVDLRCASRLLDGAFSSDSDFGFRPVRGL